MKKRKMIKRSLCLLCLSFCLLCLSALPSMAQGLGRWINQPPFERSVQFVKVAEGWHNREHYPYVGYGHKLKKGEKFSSKMTERQADSLLRADLWNCFEYFKGYGKDALLLAMLSYNVGVGRILGNKKYPKSNLIKKIEAGDRNFYKEYLSFCYYNGKVLLGLLRRRRAEFILFYIY